MIIGNIFYSIICGWYLKISNKDYSKTKSIIFPLIFNFLGFAYTITKIGNAKNRHLLAKDWPNGYNSDVGNEAPDPDKYLKFEKFKESVKSLLETKKDIYISIIPYKWDTIEKQETYGDLYWEGIKYNGSWDSIVKNAVFHFDLEYESIKDFYEIIKTHKSLDELRGDDFNLLPDGDSGADRENIEINWERPLTNEELKAFEEYGGVEQLVWETDEYDNEDVIIGRISSIEISVGDKEIIEIH